MEDKKRFCILLYLIISLEVKSITHHSIQYYGICIVILFLVNLSIYILQLHACTSSQDDNVIKELASLLDLNVYYLNKQFR